jgi:tripartite-type tricarboxylate transporter receptor subunit TctC
VPPIWKFVANEADRKVTELVVSQQVFMRSFVAPPGTPPEQVAILRTAFDATVADPAFLADAEKMKLSITPISGAKVQEVIANLYKTPKEFVERAKNVIKP